MKNRERQNTCAGFTLVEILIVLTIIGLAGLIAVPRLADTYQAMRFDTISDQLLNDLRFARQSAMNLNTKIEVNFTGGVDYTVIIADGGRQLRARAYPQSGAGWTITFAGNLPPSTFFFNRQGLPENASGNPVGGNIVITGKLGQNRNFTLFTATGMIR